MRKVAATLAALTLLGTTQPATAAQAVRGVFGRTLAGEPVGQVWLSNGHGVKARIIAWGAALQSLQLPGRGGAMADVVLSYPDMTGYEAKPQFFGATVGRFANRVAHAGFVLDGRRYTLANNDSGNSLHGGTRGFDKRLWTLAEVASGPSAHATLTRTSPDGEEGYPGTLKVSVTYALNERDELSITYRATTDKPTVVNLSNHSLFNMAGAASGRTVYDQRLMIAADGYTPVDKGLIPTGAIAPVAGTDFDFRTARPIGEHLTDGADPQLVIGRGYDHNWVLNGGVTAAPRLAVRFEDPVSGRAMEILTREPGIQFYSGNFLDATVVGAGQVIYRQGMGIALEPQHFPDSPNQPAFPSVRLDPGQTYERTDTYRFSVLP